MSIVECTKSVIESMPDSCLYVQDMCSNQHKFLNFIEFYYCDLNENVPLIIFISILFILFIFNLLSTTVDRYLSPALELISDKLKLSEAIAGVTLVALANGATDVIAGIIAGTKDSSQGFPIAVGALFGACLFTVTCVLARCLQGVSSIKVDSSTFIRDVSFLLLATAYFIFLTIIDKITPALASVFFLLYLCYFGIAIFQERRKVKKETSATEKLLSFKRDFARFGKSKTIGEIGIDNLLNSYIMKKSLKRMIRRGKSAELVGFGSEYDKNIFSDEAEGGNVRKLSRLDLDHLEGDKKVESSAKSEENNTFFVRVINIYNMPFNFIRDLTMPPFDDERWNVYLTAVTPFFGLLFAIWQFGFLEDFLHRWYLWVIYAVVTVPISLWALIKGRDHNLGVEYSGICASLTFIMSAIWLSFIVNCFMDFLSLITIISELPLNYLSLTILAWGNSLDDFFIDYIISKSGHGTMAVTGVYAGQLFNLLIGFGGSMFIQSLKNTIKPQIYDFSGDFESYHYKTDLLTIILIGSLVVVLLLSLHIGLLSKWILGKKMMAFVLVFYLSFFITSTVLTFI